MHPQPNLRRRIVTWHGLIGLLGGLLLVVMGLTGSAIVFHQEIDLALNPHLMRVTPQGERAAIEVILATAQSAMPHHRLDAIQFPQTPTATYQLDFRSAPEVRQEVFVHPYTGEILGKRQYNRTVLGFLYAVHHDLFAGQGGLYLVGISGVLLMVQAITGLGLWTGWRKLATGFRIRWQAPKPLLSFDVHNLGGFLAHGFLLLSGMTGVVIVGAHLLLEPPGEATLPPAFQSAIAPSQLLRRADQAIPEGITTTVTFPDARTLVVTKALPQDHPRFHLSSVTLDGANGQILAASRVTQPPFPWKLLIPIADLHFGTWGGLPMRIIYGGMGLMPTVLFITGMVNWQRRLWQRNKRKTAQNLNAVGLQSSMRCDKTIQSR